MNGNSLHSKDAIIVKSSPKFPPKCLKTVEILAKKYRKHILWSVHLHSDVICDQNITRKKLLDYFSSSSIEQNISNETNPFRIRFIWKDLGKELTFHIGQQAMFGEANLVKYLCLKLKLIESISHTDEGRLDELHSMAYDEQIMLKEVNVMLKTGTSFIAGSKFGVSDLFAFSILKEIPKNKLTHEMIKEWILNCQKYLNGDEKLHVNNNGEVKDAKEKLFNLFKSESIPYDNVEHPEVFTVEAMMPYLSEISDGAISKNLFLKDKKGKLYLLSALHNKPINLSDLGKKLKLPSGSLRFASEDLLFETLGVRQGCVTAYALINDMENKKVTFLLDQDVLQFEKVYFHPLVNTASTGISLSDFRKFLSITGHEIVTV